MEAVNRHERPIKDLYYKPLKMWHKEFKKCFTALPQNGKLGNIILRITVLLFSVVAYPVLGLFAICGRALSSPRQAAELDRIAAHRQRRIRENAADEARIHADAARVREESLRVLEQARENVARLENMESPQTILEKHKRDMDEIFAEHNRKLAEYEAKNKADGEQRAAERQAWAAERQARQDAMRARIQKRKEEEEVKAAGALNAEVVNPEVVPEITPVVGGEVIAEVAQESPNQEQKVIPEQQHNPKVERKAKLEVKSEDELKAMSPEERQTYFAKLFNPSAISKVAQRSELRERRRQEVSAMTREERMAYFAVLFKDV